MERCIGGWVHIDILSDSTISPSVETDRDTAAWQEKLAGYLTGLGLREIFTNSHTNSAYLSEGEREKAGK